MYQSCNNLVMQEGEPQLITPCLCSGSLKFVHQECLHRLFMLWLIKMTNWSYKFFRWIKSSDIKKCELCKFTFLMHSKVSALWNKFSVPNIMKYLDMKHVTLMTIWKWCLAFNGVETFSKRLGGKMWNMCSKLLTKRFFSS